MTHLRGWRSDGAGGTAGRQHRGSKREAARLVVPLLGLLAGAEGCVGKVIDPRPVIPAGRQLAQVICHVQRDECGEQFIDPVTSQYRCRFESVEFDGHACFDPGVTVGDVACLARYCTPLVNFPRCQVTSAIPASSALPRQACTRLGGRDDEQPTDSVSCTLTGRQCIPATDLVSGGPVCRPLQLVSLAVTSCFNPVTTSAVEACESADLELTDPRTLLSAVVPADPACAPTPALFGDTTYSLVPSPLVRAAFLGQTLTVDQRGGFARVNRNCDPDNPAGCQATRLASLRILAGDFTVAGVTVRNPEIRTNRPATVRGNVIEEGDLQLDVMGTVGSSPAPARFRFVNRTPARMGAAGTGFSLQAELTLVTRGPTGGPMTVSLSLTSAGTSVGARACDSMTPRQRLFGFEDAFQWTSTGALLSTVASPRTEGCFALGIAGSGYLVIQSTSIPPADLGPTDRMSVDLFIPSAQPNPFWLGALQAYLECPSANLFNAYLGQVELTGRPTGRFSTLSFPLPGSARNALAGTRNDCAIKFALNVNDTGQVWVLDRLVFGN